MMKTCIVSLFLLLIFSFTSLAQVAGFNENNPLSDKWALSFEGGATYTLSDYKDAGIDYLARTTFEYYFSTPNPVIFGIRGSAGIGRLTGSGGGPDPNYNKFKTPIYFFGGGLDASFNVEENIFPYIYAGVGHLHFDPKDVRGNRLPLNSVSTYARQEFLIQGELGIRFLLQPELSLNFNGGADVVFSDNLDDVRAGENNDIFFTFQTGLSFYFSGENDADKDGISDEYDACPETPQGVRVDEFGCPVDTDRDGVPDYLDKCPQTEFNVMVDNSGCPLDSDEDGVPDYLDKCSNTPPNISVDNNGCPLDQDNDGVPDYMDNCPGTAPGTEVDKFGCPPKSQEKQLPEITNMVLTGEVNFRVGKSDLLAGAVQRLDKLVEVLKRFPQTRWRIEGHTDNTGSYQTNMRLSEQRAASVADYLISRGIDASRLEVIGYGPDYPIADNRTEAGRSLNRRVSIEMIDISGGVEQTTTGRQNTNVNSGEYNSYAERNVGNMIFTDGKLYCYQVSSWRSYDKAQAEVNRLKGKGENAFIVEANNVPGLQGTWYRVRIGYFKSLSEARDHRSRYGN